MSCDRSITEFHCHKNGFSNNSEAGKKRKRLWRDHLTFNSLSHVDKVDNKCNPFSRCIDLNEVWKTLFMSRWPDHGKTTKEHRLVTNIDGRELCESDDWQQLYWERHLQMYILLI